MLSNIKLYVTWQPKSGNEGDKRGASKGAAAEIMATKIDVVFGRHQFELP